MVPPRMLELPSHVLEKLKCAKCGGYLSCGPIVINEENHQLCGRCFKILPDEVKSRCVNQIGLEAVAELLIFPCRYNVQGCVYTFPYNTGAEHELICQHRSGSIRSNNSSTTTSRPYIYQSKELEVEVNCGNTYNLEGEDKLKLNVEIAGKESNKLHVSSCEDNIKLNLEFVVSLEVVPKIAYSHLFIEKYKPEPVYDTVKYVMQSVKCTNCQKSIVNTEIFHCPFGHALCKFCKITSCTICGALANSLSQHYCKNYTKGCTILFPTSDITKHEIDCEFNDYNCPKCAFCDSLVIMVSHFVQKHEVILSNELVVILSRKDQEWYFYCHDKLFRCNYYNFDDVVEFVVIYIGNNDLACNYKCEVVLMSNNENNIKKNGKCLGWNETSLGKAISFDVTKNLRKSFQVRIAILSHDLYYMYNNNK